MQIPFEVDSPQKDENSKKEAPISNPSIPHMSQRTQDPQNPASKQEKKTTHSFTAHPPDFAAVGRQISLIDRGR